jgi:hypothetical protein
MHYIYNLYFVNIPYRGFAAAYMQKIPINGAAANLRFDAVCYETGASASG